MGYRVCITQIIRGPGVYRGREINNSEKIIFYIDFVPEKGVWVRLEKDSENLIWLCIRGEPRRIIKRVFDRIDRSFYLSEVLKNNVYNHKFINANFPTKI